MLKIGIEELYDKGQGDYTLYNFVNGCQNSMGMHYGFWEADTKNMFEAQLNENEYTKNTLGLKHGQRILDAGCGVGGVAIYLAKKYDLEIDGITISGNQVQKANCFADSFNVASLLKFSRQDYHTTNFGREVFDKIYSIESASSANPVTSYLKEMYRILKKGGELLILDGFLSKPQELFNQQDKKVLDILCGAWALQDPRTVNYWKKEMEKIGFCNVRIEDLTVKVSKTATKTKRISLFMRPVYTFFYKLGFLSIAHYANSVAAVEQGNLFKEGLLKYYSILAEKK